MKRSLVLLTAIFTVCVFVGTSFAGAEWNVYGSARMQTWYMNKSKEYVSTTATGTDSDLDQWTLQSNSRVGATVKKDSLSGKFEYGAGGAGLTANIRYLYGIWNFGMGELFVGNGDTPLNYSYSNQAIWADNSMFYYGATFSRKPMVQVSAKGFKLALVQPTINYVPTGLTAITYDKYAYADADSITPTKTTPANTIDTDSTLPKIEAAYEYSISTISIKAFAGYQTYKLGRLTYQKEIAGVAIDSGNKEYKLDSYIAGVGGKVTLGAASVAGMIFTGRNMGLYDVRAGGVANGVESGADTYPDYDIATDDIKNNSGFGGHLVANSKISDMVTLEAGVGYLCGKDDKKDELVSNGVKSTYDRDSDALVAYYAQATITLAPGVLVIPEFGLVDRQDDGKYYQQVANKIVAGPRDQGNFTYFGAKWQISF